MFFVFNKDKAISYVVTVFTVMVLFFMASFFKSSENTIETSVNEIKDDNNIINEILNENMN